MTPYLMSFHASGSIDPDTPKGHNGHIGAGSSSIP